MSEAEAQAPSIAEVMARVIWPSMPEKGSGWAAEVIRELETAGFAVVPIETTDENVNAGAEAISLSFREEGYSPEHDNPSVWDEFKRAAEKCYGAMVGTRPG